jgi:drug/metabolite transporter (DMT)-like permease
MTERRVLVFVALVAVQVFFGFHYIAAKHVMTAIPPRAWATLRAGSAALLLLPYVVVTGRRLPGAPRDLAALALFSVFGVMVNQVCFVEGLFRTDTSHSAIINSAIPVSTLLIAILAGRERASGRKLAGIAVALAGGIYLIGHSGALLPRRFVVGDLLTAINALSYSIFLVISKPILNRHSSLSVTATLLAFGSIGIAVLGLPQLVALEPATVPADVWASAAAIVLFPTVGAYVLSAWALKRVDASQVALFICLQPVIASVLAVAWLGEPLGPEAFVSAAFVFTGLAVALGRTSRAR